MNNINIQHSSSINRWLRILCDGNGEKILRMFFADLSSTSWHLLNDTKKSFAAALEERIVFLYASQAIELSSLSTAAAHTLVQRSNSLDLRPKLWSNKLSVAELGSPSNQRLARRVIGGLRPWFTTQHRSHSSRNFRNRARRLPQSQRSSQARSLVLRTLVHWSFEPDK